MKKKSVMLGAMLTTMVALLAACGSSSSSSNKKSSVTYMQGDVLQTMDPALATDVISGQSQTDVYSGLFRWDKTKLTPDMAAKMPTVSKDQKTYTFTLRKNAKWSDGKEVTAQDFVYAWKRAIDPKTKSEYAYIFSGIKNADDIIAGKKPASTLGVKALSKTKFQVQLDKVMPYFNKMITLQTFDPVEQSQVKKEGSKFGTNAKTLTFNGPYKLGKWTGSENSWTETKNNKYWNAKSVKINKIKYQVIKENNTAYNLYTSGKADDVTVTGDTATQAKNDKGYTVVKQNATYYLVPNLKRVPAFNNQKIRQAISMSINRAEFIKKVLGNGSVPAKTVVPTDMMINSKGKDFTTDATNGVTTSNYDLKKAKELFKEGMKEAGKTDLTFTLLSDDTDTAKSTLDYLQSAIGQLSQTGAKLTVKTKSVPFKTRLTLSTDGDFDMAIEAWSADFPDAISFLDMFTTGNSYNYGAWSNKQYDSLIAASKGADATNTTKRWNDMVQADQILAKQSGVIPLYQLGAAHLRNTKLQGVTTSPNGMINWVKASYK
ncbi:peptide ABC transporter substrate-binding protein [Lacticaseibacillus thailandensis]|uniref:ABC-type oligopeptide transport system, periplasmic component n=1 Tax=Lacticaseibacillus thailandensis DSM 22698 = JCM 13996 TaxID=1423810 RepID=A0A0R2C9A9_9LACO|nr:peptide ABC transporter substrate-binding protein [Lacticaseibacillus thailandensis]KRM87666.1 ABC-type oligopeptide transport system, periplasmic component [Lacticaseibacillus thailandensis DSM 22698 = JCM 13996]